MINNLFRKGLVCAIVVLFVGMSFMPIAGSLGIQKHVSIDNEMLYQLTNTRGKTLYVGGDGPNNYTRIQDTIDISQELWACGGLAYGFCDDPYDELDGVVVFDPDDPANLTIIKPGTWDISSGGCFVPPHYLYFTQYYTGMLCRLNLETLEFEIIGGGGASLNGLAYDPVSNMLYGASSTGSSGGLWIINMETGEQEYVGSFINTVWMVGIAFDADGVLYGWDIAPDCLYTIDLDSGEATEVGPLGINIGGGGRCI